MRKLFVLLVCVFALGLPMRLRVLLAEAIGWSLQLGYWVAYRATRFMMKQLQD